MNDRLSCRYSRSRHSLACKAAHYQILSAQQKQPGKDVSDDKPQVQDGYNRKTRDQDGLLAQRHLLYPEDGLVPTHSAAHARDEPLTQHGLPQAQDGPLANRDAHRVHTNESPAPQNFVRRNNVLKEEPYAREVQLGQVCVSYW